MGEGDQSLVALGHDLRTPLTAILGFTGVMLLGLPGPLNAEQRRQLEMVRSAGEEMLLTIDRYAYPQGR